jgi:predicted GNAT family acetyltransferase
MKQTAVEWLVSQLNKQGFAQVVTDEEIEQAKEMELEQRNEELIDFAQWYSGMDRDKVIRAYKRYQNETFKQES